MEVLVFSMIFGFITGVVVFYILLEFFDDDDDY